MGKFQSQTRRPLGNIQSAKSRQRMSAEENRQQAELEAHPYLEFPRGG
jgi:hypothetical protein